VIPDPGSASVGGTFEQLKKLYGSFLTGSSF
jgi:hypothetical protein